MHRDQADAIGPADATARPSSATVRDGAGRRLPALLAFLAIGLLFLVSGMALTHWGIHYTTSGGSPLAKIHPATLVSIVALALASLRGRGVAAYAGRLTQAHRGTLVFIACLAFFVLYVGLTIHQPLSPVLDNFVLPIALFLVLLEADPRQTARLAGFVHLLMAANAALGLAEMQLGWRLVPFYLAEGAVTWEWRSTAFLGHPLGNAAITGCYVVLLALGADRRLPRLPRIMMIVLQVLAMAAFGGRAATVGMTLILAAAALGGAAAFMRGRPTSMLALGAVVLVIPAALMIGAALLEHGFFDRFVERFVEDAGSARTRVTMWRLFDFIPLQQILLGPDPDLLGTHVRIEGLELGIESFPVAAILYYGVAASAALFIGLMAFLVDVARSLRPQATVCLVYFMLLNATSTGLATKTTGLGMVVVLCTLLARRSPLRETDEGGRPGAA